MKERLEVEFEPKLNEIYLKHYFNIDPPDKDGNRVGMHLFVLNPETAHDIGTKLLAAYDKSND